ncbi:triose-phosphate isomerase [Rhizobium sp. AU243]|nr:triose-phosphate isomerase [Rhizobium sp. AU243]
MGSRRTLIAGNWKMNGSRHSLSVLAEIARPTNDLPPHIEVVLFPPATLLAQTATLAKKTASKLGGQDCSSNSAGAFTGELSAAMLNDFRATYGLLGHSEGRTRHGESDDLVRQKSIQALDAGMIAVICIGETRDEKEAGRTFDVLADQLAHSVPKFSSADRIVIAYEPMWAIGTGTTPSVEEIEGAHAHLRDCLTFEWGANAGLISILYGGSVSPHNAMEILGLPSVDGLLIGGASLNPAKSAAICSNAAALHMGAGA